MMKNQSTRFEHQFVLEKGLLDEAVIEKEDRDQSQDQQQNKERQILKIKTKTEEDSKQQNGKETDDKDTVDDKKENKDDKKSTFSLFGQNNVKTDEQKPTGLFANLNNNTQTSSLFANSNQQQGLFSNLFTNNNNDKGGFFQNLNDHQPKLNFTSLFQKKEEENQQEEDDDQPVEPQSPEINPELSKGNYQYEEKQDRLIQIQVSKFKVGDAETLENGMISIEKDKEGNNLYVIYRSVLKRILYQGMLLTKLIGFKKMGSSGVSVQLNAFNKKEEKLSKDVLKIRLTKQEDCDELVKKLGELQE